MLKVEASPAPLQKHSPGVYTIETPRVYNCRRLEAFGISLSRRDTLFELPTPAVADAWVT